MAYSDDAVKAKLSALNETQESIVTVAQWIMFHRYMVPMVPRKLLMEDSDLHKGGMRAKQHSYGFRE